MQKLAQAETAPAPTDVERLRVVEDRTYYLRDDVWTDSAYVDEETIRIAAYSAAYFDLAKILPWIGPYLAVGDRAIIAVGAAFVEICEDGAESLTHELIETLTF